jgi:hypothetical protein
MVCPSLHGQMSESIEAHLKWHERMILGREHPELMLISHRHADGSGMEQQEALRRRFAETGVAIEDAVFAFSGLYPRFGGFGSFEVLFTRHRLIARIPQGLGVWVAYSGPTPTKPLAMYSLSELAIIREGGRFGRVALGRKKFWVPADYQTVVRRWSALATEGQ